VLLKVGVATGSGISTPVKVGSLAAATSLVLGRSFSCARLSDSSVWCWGEGAASNNCVSVMSPPMTSCTATHVPRVRPGFSASAVFGGSEQICGLLSPGGAPACLGIGADGLLGDGVDRSIQFVQAPQLLVAPASTATMVDFGASAGCAILSSGQVACWGANNAGQLGNGTTTTLRPSRPGFVAPL
jgi:alpha-tubulin suppressor-like RCC1 family protein